MKSHLHPERPDRLRAIAASLATAGIHLCFKFCLWIKDFIWVDIWKLPNFHYTLDCIAVSFLALVVNLSIIRLISNWQMLTCAGIFPGRCYPIAAREITQEELQKVSDHPLSRRHVRMKLFCLPILSLWIVSGVFIWNCCLDMCGTNKNAF